MSEHVVATVAEIPPAERKLVTVAAVRSRLQSRWRVLRPVQSLSRSGRTDVRGHPDRPDRIGSNRDTTSISARARSCAAPGTAGNSTSAPANPIASRSASRFAATRSRWRPASAWPGPYVAETVPVTVSRSTSWWTCREAVLPHQTAHELIADARRVPFGGLDGLLLVDTAADQPRAILARCHFDQLLESAFVRGPRAVSEPTPCATATRSGRARPHVGCPPVI